MSALIWVFVFAMSVYALVKSSDIFVESSRNIGIYFGIPSFIVGVLIVGIGTSMPELASSIAANLSGASEIVVANIVGSNMANIFLIIGISAIVAGKLKITKELIDLDIPLLVTSTAMFWILSRDGIISLFDSLFLLSGLLYYITYTMVHKKSYQNAEVADHVNIKFDFAKLAFSAIVLSVSAKFLIDSTVSLSTLFSVGVDTISVIAIAIGTSLPELFVSLVAIKKNETDMALGNIFGSNVFNMLAVGGLSALISPLIVTDMILQSAMMFMLVATALFAISGISKRIHSFEGVFYILIYVYFVSSLI